MRVVLENGGLGKVEGEVRGGERGVGCVRVVGCLEGRREMNRGVPPEWGPRG